MDNFSRDITTKLLRATFLNNMEAFKNILPEIYNYFKDYTPGDTLLTIDDDTNVNLVSNGALVYDGNPRELSKQQVDCFADDPKCFGYGMGFKDVPNFEHERVLKELTNRQLEETGLLSNLQIEMPFNESRLDFFCMVGSGLGYQIEELFNRKDIKIFYLYEPSPDVFFASMHCIDYKPLIDKCKALSGGFTISVGGNSTSFVNQINELLKVNGFFHVHRLFVYRHYLSDENFDAFKLVHDVMHRFSAGWGFFEDETISLIHTLENSEKSFPILTGRKEIKSDFKEQPVIIVGNGPSLDKDIELLKSRKDNVIIISCGTALKALLHHGITPSIHVEMERTAQLDDDYEFLSEEELKIIKTFPIISLNTVVSKLLSRFSQAYTMLKINDVGTELIEFLSPEHQFSQVKYCNPTVSNAALVAMLYLGFNNIYLLGVDLGFIDGKHHHAKGSIYDEDDWKEQEGQNKKFSNDSQKTKGNFREEVSTINILDSSKGVMEFAIQDFPDANVYNCSDGAFIVGATPLPFEELDITDKSEGISENLQKVLDDSFELFSKNKAYVHNFLVTEFFPKLRIVLDEFLNFLDKPVADRAELSDIFSRQNDYIFLLSAQKNTTLYFRFIKGSMIYFQTCIMSNCSKYTDQEMRMAYINDSLLVMKEHFEFLYKELIENYNLPAKI